MLSFLEAAPAALGTDPARQYVVGFSQGATIGWTLATAVWPRPDLLRGLCLLRRVLQHPPQLLRWAVLETRGAYVPRLRAVAGYLRSTH